MTGKPGRSGGTRQGAGAPVRTWRLRTGDTLAVWEHTDGKQVGLGRLAEILIISRNVLVIRLDDGTEIKLVRTGEGGRDSQPAHRR